jgi:acetyltransferase-like isoleucine patch superfamily enzyme
MTFLNIIQRYLKNQKRSLARRILRPWLKYFYDTSYVMGGDTKKLVVGDRSALSNTLFNVSSGVITIGNRSIFGQGVIVTTGRHEFLNGRRASYEPEFDDGSWGGGKNEVPSEGFDINIGSGVFIASGCIILGGVSIGNHCIVAAGAVVTKSFPDYSFIAGVPATRIKSTRD